jgi:hypothetical protein
MTPAAIIDALHAAGATLVIEDGKARVRGAKIADELMAAVKANRDGIIAEWLRRQEQARDRYAEVPTGDVAMLGAGLTITHAQRLAVVAYAFRQPRPVHAWVEMRMGEYQAQGLKQEEYEPSACVDLLCWQLNRGVTAAVEWLDGIEACVSDINQKPEPETNI